MEKQKLKKQFSDVIFMDIDLEFVESKAQILERVDKIAERWNAVPVCVESYGKKLKIALSKKYKETYDKLCKGTKVIVDTGIWSEVCEIVSDEPFWCSYDKCVRIKFEKGEEEVYDIQNLEIL
jgi:hypothetical protein